MKSSLADIQFRVGEITREGDYLYVHSTPGSTLETQIQISPQDARDTLWQLLTHAAVWRFLPQMLFGGRGESTRSSGDSAWQARRRRIGLNKPW
ncbi:MAG: hypothetical protein ACR2QV_05235 [Gammaproteobacteria bacterium]